MAETTFAQATPHDLADIPAYVIRSAGSASNRYHAPRLSRTALSLRELRDLQRKSLGQRLVNGWLRRRGEVFTAAHDEPVTELRYQATARVPAYAPVGTPPRPLDIAIAPVRGSQIPVGRTAAAVALCVAAGALGWVIGGQMMPASASSTRAVPASVLIAAQNLPTKLPNIEQKAPTATGLEQGHRLGRLTYVTRSGDTFASVGQRFGLTPRTVRLVNQLPLGYRLRAGQHLLITPGDGAIIAMRPGETLDEVAQRYATTKVALVAANAGINADHPASGQTVFIPGAQEIRLPVPRFADGAAPRGYRNDRNDGTGAQRLEASRSLIGQFGNRVGALSWPAAGQLSSPFGIRGYSFHPGMDICNNIGTPIHAAKAGTVISAGWSSGYGYAIDIDHGAGVVTRYGHCSRLLVKAGQKVEAGEQIALMGSTGHSTGPHVHFEVRIQGRAVNPASFL